MKMCICSMCALIAATPCAWPACAWSAGVRILEDDPSAVPFLDAYETHCARYGREPDAPILAFKDATCGAEGISADPEVGGGCVWGGRGAEGSLGWGGGGRGLRGWLKCLLPCVSKCTQAWACANWWRGGGWLTRRSAGPGCGQPTCRPWPPQCHLPPATPVYPPPFPRTRRCGSRPTPTLSRPM